ncbi:hypothetical protein SAMN05421807_103170 [Virgibacillus chiguensis]|uniref:Uncharacterized protein n=1 Tax=Virgibacillus chiguensis TaxID=411959 RepID=A0A1M5PQH3_9BACI|nr:hypothetical protein SAMN05421807_103170 [Virgibacillus chiguensis]
MNIRVRLILGVGIGVILTFLAKKSPSSSV